MKTTKKIRIMAMILALITTISVTGCGASVTPSTSNEENDSVTQTETTTPSEAERAGEEEPSETPVIPEQSISTEDTQEASDPIAETTPEITTKPEETVEESSEPQVEILPEEETDEYGLTEKQRNSFSMLYFLAITAEEIRISQDNSLVLDDIYSSLINDINPGAIDETTQTHLENLRNVIEDYIDISTKRERLQFLYNQDKAATIRSAVPNPLAILSMTNSYDWKKLAMSAVYTVVDTYNNYKSANEAVNQEFLMNGWELDDEATEAMRKNRRRAFNYMVDIVQEYSLPGKLTLNENAIETFAEICAIESVQEKTHRLESEEETYRLLGNYWLELADCYFETEQYRKCLSCVEKYNQLSTGIYRKDYNYVQILPKAIVAAQNTCYGDTYISTIAEFANSIRDNTDKNKDSWSIRYFAAQVYLDLYARTDDKGYLKEAYTIAYDNVTLLLSEQRTLNETYLADVKEVTIEEPDYRFMTEEEKKEAEASYKEEQKRLKAYNKDLHEIRKTELPSLYEPLILNCDLLFALAEEMNISYSEKQQIEGILQIDTNGVFLSDPINDRYSFSTSAVDYIVDFGKDEMVIPGNLLTDGATIVVSVSDSGKSVTFDDCIVTKVERDGKELATFNVYVSSKEMKDYQWTLQSKVTIEIFNGEEYDPISFSYKVKEYKDNWLIPDKVVFVKE